MRINKNRKIKIYITVAIVALAALAGVASYSWFFADKENPKENQVSYERPTTEQLSAGSKAKEEFNDRAYNTEESQSASNLNQSSVDVNITSAMIKDSVFSVRSIISTLDSSGTCELTFSKNNIPPVKYTADMQIMGTYSVCRGFDIPIDVLQEGLWNISLEYKGSEGRSGKTNQTVEVKL